MVGTQECVTVTGTTTRELREARDGATDADLVELRLDGAREIDIAGVLAGRCLPVVVTCRTERDGGRYAGGEEDRRRWLLEALACGAEYVDVEWDAGYSRDLVAAHGARVVLSLHDVDGMPRELEARYRAMRSTGAAVAKIAARARRLSDLLPLARLGEQVRRAGEAPRLDRHGQRRRPVPGPRSQVWVMLELRPEVPRRARSMLRGWFTSFGFDGCRPPASCTAWSAIRSCSRCPHPCTTPSSNRWIVTQCIYRSRGRTQRIVSPSPTPSASAGSA